MTMAGPDQIAQTGKVNVILNATIVAMGLQLTTATHA